VAGARRVFRPGGLLRENGHAGGRIESLPAVLIDPGKHSDDQIRENGARLALPEVWR